MRMILFAAVTTLAAVTTISIVAVGAPPARAQAPTALAEDQSAFLARCRTETIARHPNARAQAGGICASRWEQISAAGPLADAILAAAPAQGARFDAAGARGRMGALGGLDVAVQRAPAGVRLGWSRPGEPIPFDLEGAFHARGAELAMIGCQWFGHSENHRVYRVDAPGKAPFSLAIHNLNAAFANQSSTFAAVARFDAAMPTLASLNRGGDEFLPACPA